MEQVTDGQIAVIGQLCLSGTAALGDGGVVSQGAARRLGESDQDIAQVQKGQVPQEEIQGRESEGRQGEQVPRGKVKQQEQPSGTSGSPRSSERPRSRNLATSERLSTWQGNLCAN